MGQYQSTARPQTIPCNRLFVAISICSIAFLGACASPQPSKLGENTEQQKIALEQQKMQQQKIKCENKRQNWGRLQKGMKADKLLSLGIISQDFYDDLEKHENFRKQVSTMPHMIVVGGGSDTQYTDNCGFEILFEGNRLVSYKW